ncbi:MAG: 4-vinyl reductase [Thomasclavelia sp.]|jgi:predicted hydrocarbon binding protein|nr:4-vinyl reductase [Thomasclavelia sp.]
MANVFMKGSHTNFTWDKLGDIKEGRQELGESMPVVVYRMLEYAMNDVLNKEYGSEKANDLWRKAGWLSGSEFAKNMLDLTLPFDEFVASLQKTLADLKVGILRIEAFDGDTGDFTLTVAEDLDCSGLEPTNELVCNYDEGFLAGILEVYTKKPYHVREVDCWASGDRVCRFKGHVIVEPTK